ncbi:hypothetical protein HA402_007947 [Bradysia odoriphaga]|nr:hypothetical protein HA402_007947 [Bradysia odoriphaga]
MNDFTLRYVLGTIFVHLNDIYFKLCSEDQTLRTFRRSTGFRQYIKSNLLPVLLCAKDKQLISVSVRIFINLTTPAECMYANSIEIMQKTEVGRQTVSDLNELLSESKKSFSDLRSIRAIVDYMKSVLEKDSKLSFMQCDSVNNCLILLRNILHIPDCQVRDEPDNLTKYQNEIIWNLFTLNIDKLLLYLMSCTQKAFFSVTLAQLVALIYKDQHINTLQKLLNSKLDDISSDSSEDFESNTTPLKQGSGDSSPLISSDSSDNGVNRSDYAHITVTSKANIDSVTPSSDETTKNDDSISELSQIISKMSMDTNTADEASDVATATTASVNECLPTRHSLSSQSELSDCGYVTQLENQESTSSNEDDKQYHRRPPPNQKQRFNAVNNPRKSVTLCEQDSRRKKLVKRRNGIINMMGLTQHTPTDEDISHLLKEFTIDFMLKGFGNLVGELHAQLLIPTDLQSNMVDTSYFFWLITYFLRFAAQLELDFEHVKRVLSYDVLAYLAYEGVNLCEEFELNCSQDGVDLKPCFQKMHLLVTAIKEFIQTLSMYKKFTFLNTTDQNHIQQLSIQISSTSDLHCLFLLLLRHYNPTLQNKQYLEDLIVSNHLLLVLLDDAAKLHNSSGRINLMEHIEQFSTVEVMYHYGLLLTDFEHNGEYVNDCIFTMMHHIGGEIEQITALFQPVILKTFSKIYETEYMLCDDWSDLIEYVINKFINTQQSSLVMTNARDVESKKCIEGNTWDNWIKEEISTLYWYYVQSKKSRDIIGKIVKLFKNSDTKEKSRLSVIQQLLKQDIITLLEYDDLMKFEDIEYEKRAKTSDSSSSGESGISVNDSASDERAADDIEVLRESLIRENKGKSILWLQKSLVDCCFVKLAQNSRPIYKQPNLLTSTKIMKPVPYHYVLKHQSVPVVPWNTEQSTILMHKPFMLLLHKLGFHLPVDTGKVFVRIPEFWSADVLYTVAEKLGPIDKCLFALKLFPTIV